jgi:lysine-N-methylase
MNPPKLLQPRHFDEFHCIGSECEDTCCAGWMVHVDKLTYDKYQACSDPEWGPILRSRTTANENAANNEDYATIVFDGAACGFLSGGLCSMQQKLGESHMPNMCATYPRVMNRVGDVLHRSLDLSCPEAARVALLNPLPMEFDEREYDDTIRPAIHPALDTSSLTDSDEPFLFFRGVRRLVMALLQNRSNPIWKRLFLAGCLCEKLDEMGSRDKGEDGLNALREYLEGIERGGGDSAPEDSGPSSARLETVLELIVARIGSDSNPPSFLDCYRQFMEGIQWTSTATMDEIGARYSQAHAQYYAPVISRHQYILENYLVNYVHRTLFPLGLPESNRRVLSERVSSPAVAQYMLVVAHYAITQTLLIGMAGFHKAAFDIQHVVRLIQAGSKTFEHSPTYPKRVIEILADKELTTPASLCAFIRN